MGSGKLVEAFSCLWSASKEGRYHYLKAVGHVWSQARHDEKSAPCRWYCHNIGGGVIANTPDRLPKLDAPTARRVSVPEKGDSPEKGVGAENGGVGKIPSIAVRKRVIWCCQPLRSGVIEL